MKEPSSVKAAALMEPIAQELGAFKLKDVAAVSIAISIKRIADAVTGDEKNTGIHKAILSIADKESVSALEQVFGS